MAVCQTPLWCNNRNANNKTSDLERSRRIQQRRSRYYAIDKKTPIDNYQHQSTNLFDYYEDFDSNTDILPFLPYFAAFIAYWCMKTSNYDFYPFMLICYYKRVETEVNELEKRQKQEPSNSEIDKELNDKKGELEKVKKSLKQCKFPDGMDSFFLDTRFYHDNLVTEFDVFCEAKRDTIQEKFSSPYEVLIFIDYIPLAKICMNPKTRIVFVFFCFLVFKFLFNFSDTLDGFISMNKERIKGTIVEYYLKKMRDASDKYATGIEIMWNVYNNCLIASLNGDEWEIKYLYYFCFYKVYWLFINLILY